MNVTPQMYLIVLPLVFLAALVDAVGGGGGLISLPGYTLAGLDYGFASGCNKFTSTFATCSAVLRYAREKKILWLPALFASAGALPGAYLGTTLSLVLGTEVMRVFMVCAIPCVAAFMLLKRTKENPERELTRARLWLCVPVGLVIGFYDGFFGPGTGTFLILLFNGIVGMDLLKASATAKPVNLASNISSLITRLAAGQVIFALAVPAVVLGITGAQIGAKLALTKGAKFIRYVMLFVLALLLVRLITEML